MHLVEFTGKSGRSQHVLPEGGLFCLVSCPHMLAEIGIYISLMLVLGSHSSWLLVTVWVVCNQVSILAFHQFNSSLIRCFLKWCVGFQNIRHVPYSIFHKYCTLCMDTLIYSHGITIGANILSPFIKNKFMLEDGHNAIYCRKNLTSKYY